MSESEGRRQEALAVAARGVAEQLGISRKPVMGNREVTAAQQATRDRFRQAALYGKMVMADPETRAIYEEAARVKGRPRRRRRLGEGERRVRVEEELKHQRELMQEGFARVDQLLTGEERG